MISVARHGRPQFCTHSNAGAEPRRLIGAQWRWRWKFSLTARRPGGGFGNLWMQWSPFCYCCFSGSCQLQDWTFTLLQEWISRVVMFCSISAQDFVGDSELPCTRIVLEPLSSNPLPRQEHICAFYAKHPLMQVAIYFFKRGERLPKVLRNLLLYLQFNF